MGGLKEAYIWRHTAKQAYETDPFALMAEDNLSVLNAVLGWDESASS